MNNKKIGILVQKGFADKFEAQTLNTVFNEMGWTSSIITLNDVVTDLTETGPAFFYKGINLNTFDVILVREVFSQMKFAIILSTHLKKQGVHIIDNNLAQEQFLVNKIREGTSLLSAGLPFPKTFYALSLEAYLNSLHEIKEKIGYPLLVKHNSKGKGADIHKIENENELIEKLHIINNKDPKKAIKRYHIQEFLELDKDYRVLVIGRKVIGAMQRIPKEGDFRANFSLGGSVKPATLTEEMKRLAEKAIKATNVDFAGVDIVYTTDNKPYILEVNRTPGFQGFMKAFNIDIPREFLKFIEQQIQSS